MANDCDAVLIGICCCHGVALQRQPCGRGSRGDAYMKRRKLWKTGEDGLCCSSSAIQTRLGPSSLLEERSEIPIVLLLLLCCRLPPNWGKRPRYIDIDHSHHT